MRLTVEKVNHEDAAVREQLFAFLAPHEVYCLFIAGNLRTGFPDSHIYVAKRGARWVGVVGYYGSPKSVTPFATDPESARALVRQVSENHPDISYMNAVASVAEPASEELCRLGYRVVGDPRQVFMELEREPPPQPHEGLARRMAPADHEAVARLLRYFRDLPLESPVTDEELRKVRANRLRHVLAVDGQVVSTAATNGIGISAFQIIAVATHHEHRNKGYARAVCASLIRAMRNEGARKTVLFTGHGNAAARRCYEKLGFQTTGEYWVARLRRETSEAP